jgi:hypothetical protein
MPGEGGPGYDADGGLLCSVGAKKRIKESEIEDVQSWIYIVTATDSPSALAV